MAIAGTKMATSVATILVLDCIANPKWRFCHALLPHNKSAVGLLHCRADGSMKKGRPARAPAKDLFTWLIMNFCHPLPFIIAAFASVNVATTALAQGYPVRPIRLVVP